MGGTENVTHPAGFVDRAGVNVVQFYCSRIRGYAVPRNFKEMVQLGAFCSVF